MIIYCRDRPQSVYLFITGGHLGSFHLIMMKNAAVNTHVEVWGEHVFSLFLGIHLGLELLGHRVTGHFNLVRNCQVVSRVRPQHCPFTVEL